MKKLIFLTTVAVALCMSSCSSFYEIGTSKSLSDETTTFCSTSVTADLNVSDKKIEYVYYVASDYRVLNLKTLKENAINKALQTNGNADVLVSPQFVISRSDGKITQIRVTGYPANYVNFRNIE